MKGFEDALCTRVPYHFRGTVGGVSVVVGFVEGWGALHASSRIWHIAECDRRARTRPVQPPQTNSDPGTENAERRKTSKVKAELKDELYHNEREKGH